MVSIVCYWMKETKSNRDSLHAWEVPEVGESPRSGSLRGRGVSEVGKSPRSGTSRGRRHLDVREYLRAGTLQMRKYSAYDELLCS